MASAAKFSGIYRGTVVNNVDPKMAGRLLLKVPAVLGAKESMWAARCVPLAGKGKGVYFVPEVGDDVLVAFANGDARAPIVLGSLWNAGDAPPEAAASDPSSVMTIASKGQHSIVIRDMPGPINGITIKSASGAMIMVNDLAITIDNGKGASIVMEGPNVIANGRPLAV
jgi:uncharacterized protein involved in type VI secretion and phage assembly